MPWVATKTDYAEGYIPTPTDFNRIEGNIEYLREENKNINGTTTLNALLTVSSSGISSSSATVNLLKASVVDTYCKIFRDVDVAVFAHVNALNVAQSGFYQNTLLETFINAPTGQQVRIRNNNINKISISNTEAAFDVAVLPTTSPVEGSWTQTNSSVLIPRGIYNIQLTPSGSSTGAYIEMFVNGAWTVIASSFATSGEAVAGIGIFSDGVNLRFRALNGTVTARYLKF